MSTILNDVRYALRQSRHAPGATLLIVLALALAIGANAMVFSLIDTLLLHPLGVEEPETLVRVGTSTENEPYGSTSWPDYVDLRDRTPGLSGVAATGWTLVGYRRNGVTERVVGEMVTWNYWPVLGVVPELGRSFLEEEDARGAAAAVVVVSHAFWRSRLGGDPDVLGSTVSLSGVPYTVVGVAPSGFRGLSTVVETDVWVPAMMVDRAFTWDVNLDGRGDPWVNVIARLAPGVGMARVQASLDRLGSRLRDDHPETNTGKTFTAVELERTQVTPNQTSDAIIRGVALLQGLMLLVLLTACFNVASVFMARANRRGRDVALQFALGATRSRVARQLVIEGFLVASVAAIAGLIVGRWAAGLFWGLQAQLELTLAGHFTINARVVAFTVGIVLATTVVCSLVPALYAARRGGLGALRARASGTSGHSGLRSQRLLVAGQVALSGVVVLVAGLFVRSYRATMEVDPGFDLRDGVIAMVNLGFIEYDPTEARGLQDRIAARVEALPGVASATLTTMVPLGPGGGRHDVWIPGYEPAPEERMVFRRIMIDGDYLATMGVDVVEGRGIDDRDRRDTQPVAVVNETMARRYWPGGDAVGSLLYADQGVARRVVGIVADVMYEALLEPPQPMLAIPLSQATFQPRVFLVARSDNAPGESLVEPVRRQVAALAPELPLTTTTVREQMQRAGGSDRLGMLIASFAGLLALVVALAGVYGVTVFAVSRRTHEFGVRMAMGASGGTLVRQVVGEGLWSTGLGLGAGLVLALAVARLAQGMFCGVVFPDIPVFATVGALVAGTALLAAYAPARRAADTEPMRVLRAE